MRWVNSFEDIKLEFGDRIAFKHLTLLPDDCGVMYFVWVVGVRRKNGNIEHYVVKVVGR